MVGVNYFTHRIGTVAVFATLFVAISVKGEQGCVFNFENAGDFDLECNGAKNSWKVNTVENDDKVLGLVPEQDGCLKTKNSVVLNATSRVILRFFREAGDKSEKFTLSLKPKEGSCPDEECVWNVAADPQSKPGSWVTAEYKFPLKSMREYNIQVEVDKTKGKFLLDHITIPNAIDKTSTNQDGDVYLVAHQLVAVEGSSTGGPAPAPSESTKVMEISKNLIITSVSVLTLNTLLN